MKLKISDLNDKTNDESKLEIDFCHDIYGNVFVKTKEKYYLMTISTTDDIEWIELNNYEDLEKVNNQIKYSNIKNTYEKKSLKGKIIKEIDENESDEEEDENEYFKNKKKICPEDKLYTTEIVDANENDDLETNENLYKFSKFGDNSVLPCLDRALEVSSNYDTYVINGNTSYVLLTLISNENSGYRVSIFLNGKVVLNIVGTKFNTYELHYIKNEENMSIVCNKINTNFVS